MIIKNEEKNNSDFGDQNTCLAFKLVNEVMRIKNSNLIIKRIMSDENATCTHDSILIEELTTEFF